MNKFNLIIIVLALSIRFNYAQISRLPVFISGTEGHKTYRIPALITTPAGTLLAFCEGRVSGSGDFGDINIVLKRSTDGGSSWKPMQTVVDYDKLQEGNPAPVIDRTDPRYPYGRIFLFYNTGNNHEGEVRKGNGLREVWYKTSIDEGLTWSDAVNITTQTHHPYQPNANPAYTDREDWRSYANTPGHALQILSGKYKGRLYIAANHSAGNPLPKFEDYHAHGYYSDDHGLTFHLSETIGIPGSNEATAAELSEGGLMINARNQQGDIRSRIIAISNNGGQSWARSYFDHQLPDPVCEGSLLNIGIKHRKHILAFTNAANTRRRDSLSLRISMDEGVTWNKKLLLDAAPDVTSEDFTAYSDIVLLDKKHLGVLYERAGYAQIVFTVINWKKM